MTHGEGLSSVILGLQEAGEHLLPDSVIFLGLDPEGVPFFSAACRPESEGELISLTAHPGTEVCPICTLSLEFSAPTRAFRTALHFSRSQHTEWRQGRGSEKVCTLQVRWVNLRKEGPKLPGHQAALLALAQALVAWNNNNAFCGRTGAPTVPLQGGHARSVTHPLHLPMYYPVKHISADTVGHRFHVAEEMQQ